MASTSIPVQGVFTNDDVDSAEDILILGVVGHETLWLSFVVGTASLTALTVELRVHPDGDWFTIASAAADFTTPEGPILGASGDLTTAASGSTVHWLKMDVSGVVAVRVKAAGSSSTIAGHYGLT